MQSMRNKILFLFLCFFVYLADSALAQGFPWLVVHGKTSPKYSQPEVLMNYGDVSGATDVEKDMFLKRGDG